MLSLSIKKVENKERTCNRSTEVWICNWRSQKKRKDAHRKKRRVFDRLKKRKRRRGQVSDRMRDRVRTRGNESKQQRQNRERERGKGEGERATELYISV